MHTRFASQPFEDGSDLRDFFTAVAMAPDLHAVHIVVAWAKRSGLSRIADQMTIIRNRGAIVKAIAGVSEGGATSQGLDALLAQTDAAWVFHDRGRTFHPKVYIAEGEDRALLLVGSHNLTAGGLAWNYEAGLQVELDLSEPEDLAVRDDVMAYFDRLIADVDVCIRLDHATLAAMLDDTSLLIQDEDHAKRPAALAGPDAPEDDDSVEPGAALPVNKTVFGKSSEKKRAAPKAAAVLRLRRGPFVVPRPNRAPVTGGVGGERPDLEVVKRWFKQMDGTAAQHPPGATTNPTGNLRLSQESFAIDHRIYFRNVLFGDQEWIPNEARPGMEELWLPFETVVDGDYLGPVNLRISHLPDRVSGQGNVPTVLHWGDLGARLRQNNYVEQFVTLERGTDDAFALTIAPEPTGDFAY